jgi:hypothetical protein
VVSDARLPATKVKDIRPGPNNSSSAKYLTNIMERSTLAPNDGTNGEELWKAQRNARHHTRQKHHHLG